MEAKRSEKQARPKSRQSIAHIPSRSNTTTDIAAIKRANDTQVKSKRTRGKSIGPGGLEALTETSANILRTTPSFQPRSILKPSIPLTPPKTIPSFDDLRKKSANKDNSPARTKEALAEDLLIDFSTPGPSRENPKNASTSANTSLVDPFSPITRQEPAAGASQTSGQHGSSTVDDDEEQRRKAERKAAMDQRAARRKSLANRRVSFAPEATLHTWSVMELLEDSTTSSASNSTRRQSSMTAAQSPADQGELTGRQRMTDRPTTPVEQHNDEVIQSTPESQRSLHQRKRRRSSDTMQSSDDEIMSSPGDRADSSPIGAEDSMESDSDTDGDTAMSLDEATSNTIRSSESSSTQTSLDERLRQAANQAGTRGIQHDENLSEDEDDQSMEIADATITHAFQKYGPPRPSLQQPQPNLDKENINHFTNTDASPMNDESDFEQEEQTMGMTMDMTRAVGGIVTSGTARQAAKSTGRRRSNAPRRTSSGNDSSYGDETMDLTIAKGGILANEEQDDDDNVGAEDVSDGDMTMEMTKAIGGLRNPVKREFMQPSHIEDTESMDMTVAAGGILDPIEEQTEPQIEMNENMTDVMDMTRAVGKILHAIPSNDAKDHASPGALNLPDAPTPSTQLDQELKSAAAVSSSSSRHMATIASDTGSPTLRPRHSARKSTSNAHLSTPPSVQASASPRVNGVGQGTPPKQLTPMLAKSTSPQRTPLLPASVSQRGASPKKLFAKELRERASPATRKSPRRQQDMLFSRDENTGLHTPRVVLHAPKPHQHLRGKGGVLGTDEKGHGSPRVSEILSRRSSIGDAVPEFQLQQGHKRNLRFENPQELAHEIEAERLEEHRRESGRFIMEQEVDEQQQDENTTQNLRGMIESMSPKKEKTVKLKGRKSLAVGSARGLLGKRPAELDVEEDPDNDEESTPKRLKIASREGSPVKKVHLPKPPTKEQTTGRLTKAEQLALATVAQSSHTPTLSHSPPRNVRSPEHTGHFRDSRSHQKPQSFETRLDNVIGATDVSTTHPDLTKDADEEKISLQQFLTMTNIHFIELSTTKRRHTMAPSSNDADATSNLDETSKAVFSAAATTLPLLELYQHASRELKSYISSGRKIIRTIEAETLADQPAIFKKYVDARPDQKVIMDNQFRNAKTNARLQSKEGWYSWRGQLVDGLRSGLEGVRANLERDEQILTEQQNALEEVVPEYETRKDTLEQELAALRRRLSDLESFDHEALEAKRHELADMDKRVSTKTSTLAQLQQQTEEKNEVLSQAGELRQEMSDQISEAQRVQEEQRGWHSKDVAASKKRVDQLEAESGWKLLTAEEDLEEPSDLGVALTLRYQGQLRLFFYPSAFQANSDGGRRRSGRRSGSVSGPSAPISLTYSPDEDDETRPKELPTELRFFLQLIRSQLHTYTMMPKGTVTCQTLLKTVSQGWSLAQQVAQEIRQLNSAGIVHVAIQGDEKLCAKLMVMQSDRSRIDIEFSLTVSPLSDGDISANTVVTASPVYGPMTTLMDASKTRKIQTALSKEVESKTLGEGSWISAMRGFEEWLQAQVEARAQQAQAKQNAAKSKPATQAKALDQQPAIATKLPRATTQSPQRPEKQIAASTTPKVPPRSPLAPRTTNTRLQKKALPVPKKPVNFSTSQSQSYDQSSVFSTSIIGREASQQKENLLPIGGVGIASKMNGEDVANVNGFQNGNAKTMMMGDVDDDVFGGSQPAIPPEVQEAMMHTPLKRRVGALRRSPI